MDDCSQWLCTWSVFQCQPLFSGSITTLSGTQFQKLSLSREEKPSQSPLALSEVYGEVKLGCMTSEWNNQLKFNLLEEGCQFLACVYYFKNILSEEFMKMMKLKCTLLIKEESRFWPTSAHEMYCTYSITLYHDGLLRYLSFSRRSSLHIVSFHQYIILWLIFYIFNLYLKVLILLIE